MKNKVLVVDDEQSIVTLLQYNLEQAGFEVVTAMDGLAGKQLAESITPDIIVLDLMLPKMDGIEVCKQLRQQKIMTPILMLTAKDDEFDKILGLELGADDYMIKPFSPREVVARVKAILRRVQIQTNSNEADQQDGTDIVIGDLQIIPEKYEAYFKNQQLELTLKEYELLHYLAQNKNRVLTRDQLLSAVWNYEFAGDTRIVDVHISHLREKLKLIQKNRLILKPSVDLGISLRSRKVNDQIPHKASSCANFFTHNRINRT